MTDRLADIVLVAATGILLLAACSSDSDDVATLKTTDDAQVEATDEATDSILDEEATMMAFSECLRDHGIEALDPVVDADGNVAKPDFPEGAALLEGGYAVEKKTGPGQVQLVAVEVGFFGSDNMIAVTSDNLQPGDQVVVP
jgi:hypothetical protein